jgi:hypothetical protein
VNILNSIINQADQSSPTRRSINDLEGGPSEQYFFQNLIEEAMRKRNFEMSTMRYALMEDDITEQFSGPIR